LAELVYLGLV